MSLNAGLTTLPESDIAKHLAVAQGLVTRFVVLEQGAGSIASLIFLKFPEATPVERSGLVAAGLALVLLTFGVSLLSRVIVNRKRIS